MAKSGRERKVRRRARKVAEAAVPAPAPIESRGLGERTERRESGLTEVKEARMIERAVKWNKSSRWPTRASLDEIASQQATDVVSKAVHAAVELLDGDDRAKGIALRAIVQMERQNQIDDQKVLGAGIPGGSAPSTTQVNVNVGVAVSGSADERRMRIASVAARLGLGDVVAPVSDRRPAVSGVATGGLPDGNGAAV